ncbi:MAG: hypothetical protein ACYCWE_14045 [Eubacteriales bacterium]
MNNNPHTSQRRKPHRAVAFLQNKIFILFFLPVIALIIIIAVVLIIRLVDPSEEEIPVAAVGDYIYVLPIKERPADDSPVAGKDPFSSGGTAALVLDGIMYNPDGTSIVILRSADASYVVSPDGAIGQTGWVVTDITADTVTITKNEKSEILSLTAEAVAGLYNNNTEVS